MECGCGLGQAGCIESPFFVWEKYYFNVGSPSRPSVRWMVEIHSGLIQHRGCGWKVGCHFPQPLFGGKKAVFEMPQLTTFDPPFHTRWVINRAPSDCVTVPELGLFLYGKWGCFNVVGPQLPY